MSRFMLKATFLGLALASPLCAQTGRNDIGVFNSTAQEPRGARLALVIGQGNTPADESPRELGASVARRSHALAESLAATGFTVRLLTWKDRAVTPEEFHAELELLAAQVGRGDVVVFAYVGPGGRLERRPGMSFRGEMVTFPEVANKLRNATKVGLLAHLLTEDEGEALPWFAPAGKLVDGCAVVESVRPTSEDVEGTSATVAFAHAWQRGSQGAADENGDSTVSFREQSYFVARALRAWSYEHARQVSVELQFDPDPKSDFPLWGYGTTRTGKVIVIEKVDVPESSSEPFALSAPTMGPPPGGRGLGKEKARGRNGGKGTEQPVAEGLAWLSAHQDADGRWDADEFDEHCSGDPACKGKGGSLHDSGLTGLALLAFLGDGHHPLRNTEYVDVVRRGVTWLVQHQAQGTEDDGLIGGRSGHNFIYNHALATLALCEAYLLSEDEALAGPAQRAVNFILRARNPYKAWRYSVPPNGENDTSITGWMTFVLKTAEDAGLTVDKQAYEGALTLFNELTDPHTGRCGYMSRGENPARPEGMLDRYPAEASESLTAVALLGRIFLGERADKQPLIRAHADLLLEKLPKWSDDGSSNDFYYWYYGSYAMMQMGGKYWKRWNDELKPALILHQERAGHAKGSWNPVGPWGHEGGRVYATALATLCLEVTYRYARLQGE